MIILDTNVLSELMRETVDPRVLEWASAQESASLFTTAISEAEVFAGLSVLPSGKRRRALEEAAAGLFADLDGRVLPFDSAAARLCAQVTSTRLKIGRPIPFADAQIAGIARSRGARVATRDGDGFAACSVDVVDPWRA